MRTGGRIICSSKYCFKTLLLICWFISKSATCLQPHVTLRVSRSLMWLLKHQWNESKINLNNCSHFGGPCSCICMVCITFICCAHMSATPPKEDWWWTYKWINKGTDGQTTGQTDRGTDGWKDGYTYEQTENGKIVQTGPQVQAGTSGVKQG